MGPEPARPYSRPPRLEDLVALCKALNEEGARYAVIGGFAMILHGYVRGTMDVDLLIDPAPDNVRLVKRALSRLADNAAAEVAETDVERYEVVRVGDEIVVDLLGKACSVDFAEARPRILHRSVEGVAIPFLDAETLIRTKATPRPKDQQDVLFLRHKLHGG